MSAYCFVKGSSPKSTWPLLCASILTPVRTQYAVPRTGGGEGGGGGFKGRGGKGRGWRRAGTCQAPPRTLGQLRIEEEALLPLVLVDASAPKGVHTRVDTGAMEVPPPPGGAASDMNI